MKSERGLIIAIFCFFYITTGFINAQKDEKISPFKGKGRSSKPMYGGFDGNRKSYPQFPANFSFYKRKFEIGSWGSTDFVGSYKEVDPYISFTAGNLNLELQIKLEF